MYNVYLSVPLPGWLFCTPECWRARRSNHPKLKPRSFIQYWPCRGKYQSHNMANYLWINTLYWWMTNHLSLSDNHQKNSNWKIFSRSFFLLFPPLIAWFHVFTTSNHIITYKQYPNTGRRYIIYIGLYVERIAFDPMLISKFGVWRVMHFLSYTGSMTWEKYNVSSCCW
jgi:hypothetical protein